MEQAMTATGVRREVVGMGICPKCNVIYKVRMGEVAPDGVYRCHACGSEVELKKRPK